MTPHEMVMEFHKAFGAPIGVGHALIYDDAVNALRRSLVEEEVQEFKDGQDARDIVEVIDALADIVYVCYGAAVAYGVNLDPIIEEVHRSNMSKLGEDGKPIYREDGKVLKGPSYFKPDIPTIIKRQRALNEERKSTRPCYRFGSDPLVCNAHKRPWTHEEGCEMDPWIDERES